MVSDYKDQSKGDNQFELLTDYLIILEPIVYKYMLLHLELSPIDRIRTSRKNPSNQREKSWSFKTEIQNCRKT
jgi:hypothetical protein